MHLGGASRERNAQKPEQPRGTEHRSPAGDTAAQVRRLYAECIARGAFEYRICRGHQALVAASLVSAFCVAIPEVGRAPLQLPLHRGHTIRHPGGKRIYRSRVGRTFGCFFGNQASETLASSTSSIAISGQACARSARSQFDPEPCARGSFAPTCSADRTAERPYSAAARKRASDFPFSRRCARAGVPTHAHWRRGVCNVSVIIAWVTGVDQRTWNNLGL
jgi:hypothetical protein